MLEIGIVSGFFLIVDFYVFIKVISKWYIVKVLIFRIVV